MNQYFYYWRMGWVAFIALALCAFGINLLARAALFLVGIDTSDEFTKRIGVAALVFLVLGLPYAGWVFHLAIQKAKILVRPGQSNASKSNDIGDA
jgi:hypothetical protein